MKRDFCGVWAVFPYLEDVCGAIRELQEKGFRRLTVHSPYPCEEIQDALGRPKSWVGLVALAGASLGILLAIVIIIKMTLDWIIPVSAKPILSIPNMVPVGFELSVLVFVYFTLGGIGIFGLWDTFRNPLPKDRKYKEYDGFMRDRFGLVVPCDKDQVEEVEALLSKFRAEEVNVEV